MDLEYKSGVLFIRLEGNLIRKTNYKINNYIIPVIIKHQIKYVIYNLKNLKSIDESGLDSILNTKCKIKRLKIRKVSDEFAALKKLEVNM